MRRSFWRGGDPFSGTPTEPGRGRRRQASRRSMSLDSRYRRVLGPLTLSAKRCPALSPFDPDTLFALVADDNALMRAVLKMLLQKRGFVVLTAHDGEEAVELAPMFPFSLIITDIEMPRADGLEAVRRIRAMGGALAAVPVIANSGRDTPLSPQECRDAGIDAFVPKTGKLDPLVEALEKLTASASRTHLP